MVINKSFIVLIFQLLQTLISVFSLVLISRGLEVSVFGNYIYITTLCSLISLFSGLGFEHSFLMGASRDNLKFERLFDNAILVRTCVNFCFLFISIIFNILTKFEYFEYSIFLFSYTLSAFVNPLFIAHYRVNDIHIKPWILSFIGPLFFLLFLTFKCTFSNLLELAYGFLISNLFMFLVFCFDLRKNLRIRIHKRSLIENNRISLVFMTSQVFDYIFLRIDILLVKFLLGTYFLGLYAAGQRLVSFFQIIPSSFHIVELPVFHRLSNNISELQKRFLQLRAILLYTSVFLFGLLNLNAPLLINMFFSSKYVDAVIVVNILSIAGIINFISYPYYMLAEALNNITKRLYIRIVTLFFTICLIFVLSFFYKMIGAAIAILFGNLFFLLSLHFLTRNGNGLLKLAISEIKFLVISCFLFIIPFSFLSYYSNSIFWSLLCNLFFVGALGFLIYRFNLNTLNNIQIWKKNIKITT